MAILLFKLQSGHNYSLSKCNRQGRTFSENITLIPLFLKVAEPQEEPPSLLGQGKKLDEVSLENKIVLN
jgi:hypothetical protein